MPIRAPIIDGIAIVIAVAISAFPEKKKLPALVVAANEREVKEVPLAASWPTPK